MDQFQAGQMGSLSPTDLRPLSVCGTDERKDAVCFASSNPAEYDRSRPVARLLMAGSSLCTGWRVGPDNRMFTNNHCFADQATLTNTEVWFNYQNTSCGGSTQGTVVKVTGGTLLRTDATLDYSLFTINDFSKVASFGYLGLDVAAPVTGSKIFIAQHGAGKPKQLALTSDRNAGSACQIDNANVNGNGTGTDVAYYCDTEGGSSGSPVIASNSKKAIALHHFGGCTNQGVKMSSIWPQVATHFNNQVPGGDTGTPSNQAPVANFSASCTELSCQFNGSASSDADGSIASYAWSFGDGRTATGAQASNSYAAAGSYNVTLTVTDDRGATGAKTTTVYPSTTPTGFPKTNLSAAKDAWLRYSYVIPVGKTSVTFSTAGGTGDADLYLRKGSAPDKSNYGCRSWASSNTESCSLTVTAGDTVHIGVNAYKAFSGLTLSLK
ncbi:MAG: PKD domain-containing protein [Inhella sp.]